MPRITLTTTFQTFGPTAAAEVWQCHKGQALLSLEAGTDNDRGIVMNEGDVFDVATGKTVYVRATGSRQTIVSRETVG